MSCSPIMACEVHPTPCRTSRILLVDDDEQVLRAISRLLHLGGHEVVSAKKVTDAIGLLRGSEFDAVLSDIQMPGGTGLDLLRVVQGDDLDVPVILMTGEPRVETAALAVEHGALYYLVKPIDPSALHQAVSKAITRRQALREQKAALERLASVSPESEHLLAQTFDSALSSLWMAFQPIVSSDDGHVFGYEALLRSEEEALPHPSAVLAAAERLDRLPELGRTIRALSAASFRDAAPGSLLFVNLHARDLADPTLIDRVAPLSQISERVVLEVTERAAMRDADEVRAKVGELRRLGFRIAVDDLGAGYAGLTSFALLEPEFVKLDMSIVRDVHRSAIKRKLIGSITTLCREMGVRVVAEGIETTEELIALRGLGCDLLQGYLFARPGRPFPTTSWPL